MNSEDLEQINFEEIIETFAKLLIRLILTLNFYFL